MALRFVRWRGARVAIALLMVCVLPSVSLGYSVLTHEAIIDSMWLKDIVPVLMKKFPHATEPELLEAHGYAYGGAIIQDMGFYPFGSRFYSDLTHYVRSGEFVETLLRDATTVGEYAFAIGALSHYCADNDGHTIATNSAVAMLYPKLQRKYGKTVTYQQSPSAHMQTEFGFDVLQLAEGHYAPQAYHDFIGFHVAKPLLARAFAETYGLELSSLFGDLDLAIGTYRRTISSMIPMLTRIAWQTTKPDLKATGVAQQPRVVKDSAVIDTTTKRGTGTRSQFLYNLSRAEYNKEWGDRYQKPGFFSKVFAFLIRILPKVGPFKAFGIKRSTPETELLFMRGFNATTVSYRALLGHVSAGTLDLANRDLDTGKPTDVREYGLADHAYARLVHQLADTAGGRVSPSLRANILAFYRDTTMRTGTKKDSAAWRSTLIDLAAIRGTETGHAR